MPTRLFINDVAVRDGFQIEKAFVPTATKVALIDELSTTGPNEVWEVHDGTVHHTVVDPEDLGLARASLADLRGGDAADNAAITRAMLAGERGPVRDIVLLNAAAGLVAAGASPDWHAALADAARAVDSGAALTALERMVEVSNRTA